jgi:predicted dehydrogenase
VQLELQFDGLRSSGSISKTIHGAGNQLEVVVVGTEGLMEWRFERPDELFHARGKQRMRFFRSSEETVPSLLPPNHALGWLEGYVSILQSSLLRLQGKPAPQVPTLKDSLAIAEVLLKTDFIRQTEA